MPDTLNKIDRSSFLRRILRGLAAYTTKNYFFYRLLFLVFCDFFITFSSLIAAIFIYTRLIFIPYSWSIIVTVIFAVFFVKFVFFILFHIYDISFQHASILYIIKTSSIILASSAVSYFLIKALFPAYWFFALTILYVLFDVLGSIGFRFLPLIYYEICSRIGEESKNCLIYGCGDTGKSLMPVMTKNRVRINGFIDDDPNKLKKVINGIKVLGALENLGKILTKTRIDVLIVAIPSLEGRKFKRIKKMCSEFNIELKTIPSLYQIYNKNRQGIADSIRLLNYEDLIRRPVRKENFSDLNDFFGAKKIIITGAGSIGGELVNQLINFDLKKIIVLDNCELNLFNLKNRIDKKPLDKIELKLIDLKNKRSLEGIFAEEKPDFVFHTAAYKHVPIVEQNTCEAVLNNLLCLKNIYEVSSGARVKKFIFVSSDKAVRSTNIMGATKRLGELYLQARGISGGMVSLSVRFGNVIGSSGSLVPGVIEQIRRNGPVTVTHPDASRFFMLVSEAVLLILKASVIAGGGEVFILDMGKPIKIIDMVKDIISFYGKIPEVEIPIEYIGLRPGEKLFEELIFDGVESKTYADGMYVTRSKAFDFNEFINAYDAVLSLAREANENEMLRLIKRYVKIYTNEQLLKNRE